MIKILWYVIGILLIIIGTLCLGFNVVNYIDTNKKPHDISSLSSDKLESGIIVEGDITYNAGLYASSESESDVIHMDYIIPAGNGYIGFHAKSNDLKDALADQLENGNSQIKVHIKGKVRKFVLQEEVDSLNAFIKEKGISDCSTVYFVDEITKLPEWTLVFGSFCLALGIFWVILTKKTAKKEEVVNQFGIPVK